MPTWTPTYAVGHALIDAQHQELFSRADALLEAMHEGRAGGELGGLLEFLGAYAVEHFGAEEQLMRTARYPATASHQAEHAQFIRRYRENLETFRRSGATSLVVLDTRDMIRGWLVHHVCTVDVQLAAYLRGGEAAG